MMVLTEPMCFAVVSTESKSGMMDTLWGIVTLNPRMCPNARIPRMALLQVFNGEGKIGEIQPQFLKGGIVDGRGEGVVDGVSQKATQLCLCCDGHAAPYACSKCP